MAGGRSDGAVALLLGTCLPGEREGIVAGGRCEGVGKGRETAVANAVLRASALVRWPVLSGGRSDGRNRLGKELRR